MHARPLFFQVLLAALTTGCNGIVGIHDPIDAVPAVPKTDGGGAEVTAFLGTWQNTMGTIMVTCNGTSKSLSEMNVLTITRGTSSDLLITSASCALTANVSGDTATLVRHQPCVVAGPAEKDSYDILTGSFVLGGDGLSGDVTLAGDVTVEAPGKTTLDCTFVQTDPYSKAAP